MLLNDFFTILEEKTEGDTTIYKVKLNENHTIFDGHFPGDPIVPGVCQLQILIDILTQREQVDYFLSESNQIKYISVIKPQETPTFFISFKVEKKEEVGLVLTARFYNEDLIYFKMKGKFTPSLVA